MFVTLISRIRPLTLQSSRLITSKLPLRNPYSNMSRSIVTSIPVIDLDKVSNLNATNNSNSALNVAEEIRDALHKVGFMYLVNHRIPPENIKSAFQASSQFFALEKQTKLKYKKIPVETNHGWVEIGQELLHPNSVFEFRESFDFVHGSGRFIPEAPLFTPTMDVFKLECQKFMKQVLLPLLSLSLKLEDVNFFTNCCTHLDNPKVGNECDLRVICYPSIGKETEIPLGTIRCAEHTDYELCTLLFQDDVGGLEVQNSEGNWISATPIPGAILVNTGDLLEHWSCGYYPATKHRVIIPAKEIQKRIPRYSFAYFFAPDNETEVSPLIKRSSVLQEHFKGREDEFEDRPSIKAYDHIMARVKEAYQY